MKIPGIYFLLMELNYQAFQYKIADLVEMVLHVYEVCADKKACLIDYKPMQLRYKQRIDRSFGNNKLFRQSSACTAREKL